MKIREASDESLRQLVSSLNQLTPVSMLEPYGLIANLEIARRHATMSAHVHRLISRAIEVLEDAYLQTLIEEGSKTSAAKFCTQKDCTNPATYKYIWPGAEGLQYCCLLHQAVVLNLAHVMGFIVILEFIDKQGVHNERSANGLLKEKEDSEVAAHMQAANRRGLAGPVDVGPPRNYSRLKL